MGKPRGKRGYIFQRKRVSANWYVKLSSPDGKRQEISLGTSDRAQAETYRFP